MNESRHSEPEFTPEGFPVEPPPNSEQTAAYADLEGKIAETRWEHQIELTTENTTEGPVPVEKMHVITADQRRLDFRFYGFGDIGSDNAELIVSMSGSDEALVKTGDGCFRVVPLNAEAFDLHKESVLHDRGERVAAEDDMFWALRTAVKEHADAGHYLDADTARQFGKKIKYAAPAPKRVPKRERAKRQDRELSPEQIHLGLETELLSTWMAKENSPRPENEILTSFFGDNMPTNWVSVPSERFNDISVERPEPGNAEAQGIDWMVWLHTYPSEQVLVKRQDEEAFRMADMVEYVALAKDSLIDSEDDDLDDPDLLAHHVEQHTAEELAEQAQKTPNERDIHSYASWNMLQDALLGNLPVAPPEIVRQVTEDLQADREGPDVVLKRDQVPDHPPEL